MKKYLRIISVFIFCLVILFTFAGCFEADTDEQIENQQEVILAEANNEVGLPAISNFREKRILKDLYELRDQEDLITYTYIWNEMLGNYTFLGITIGFGIPYATQYSNPEKSEYYNGDHVVIAQAEPNGLFSPASAEGTWVMMYNEETGDVSPAYIEPRISVFTDKLPDSLVNNP